MMQIEEKKLANQRTSVTVTHQSDVDDDESRAAVQSCSRQHESMLVIKTTTRHKSNKA